MKKFFMILALSLFVSFQSTAAMSATGSIVSIKSAVNQAAAILDDQALASSKNTRHKLLRQIIYREFDFGQISQRAVGSKWKRFSRAQKQRFIRFFKPFLTNTYLSLIEKYPGGKVQFTGEIKKSSKRVRLNSIVKSKGKNHKIAYDLVRTSRGWKVSDVIVKGVSVTSNYRAQFRSILKGGSVDSFLSILEKKLGSKNLG